MSIVVLIVAPPKSKVLPAEKAPNPVIAGVSKPFGKIAPAYWSLIFV